MSREKQSKLGVWTIAGLLLGGALLFWLFIGRSANPNAPSSGSNQFQFQATNTDATARAGRVFAQAEKASALQRLFDGLQEIYGEADSIKREARIEAWLREVAAQEITALIEFLDREPATTLHNEIVLRLFRKLADHAPETAAHLAEKRTAGPERQRLLSAVAIVWAGKNLTDTIAWARALPEEERGAVLTKVAYEAVATDPLKALELARDLPADEMRDELITHVAGEWAVKDPQQIADWARGIPDDELRQQAISRIATTWGDTNPAGAAELALKSLPPGKPQDDAVMGIVQRWVQKEPSEAAAWVAQFPEGRLRETAVEELVKLWADKNVGDAGAWLGGLPAGPSRDAGMSEYVGRIAEAQPASAAQWAQQIGNEAVRQAAIQRVAAVWMKSDPDQAQALLKRLNLPAPDKGQSAPSRP